MPAIKATEIPQFVIKSQEYVYGKVPFFSVNQFSNYSDMIERQIDFVFALPQFYRILKEKGVKPKIG